MLIENTIQHMITVFIYTSIVWLFCTRLDEQLYIWNCTVTEILVRQRGWLSMPLQQPSFVWDFSRYIESCLGLPFSDLLSCYIFLFKKEGLKWTTSTIPIFKRQPFIQQKFPGPKFPWQYIAFLLLLRHCENKVVILATTVAWLWLLQWCDLLIHCWKNIHVVGADTWIP